MNALLGGVVSSLTIGIGYLPVSFSFGLSAVQAGLPPGFAVLVSVLVFAGGSQFVLIGLMMAGGSMLTIVPSVLLMNARHLLYARPILECLHQKKRTLPAPLLAFGLTDEVFASAVVRMRQIDPENRERWLVGLQCGAYAAWVFGTVLGVAIGNEVVDRFPIMQDALSFVLPALFLSLLLNLGGQQKSTPVLVSALATLILLWLLPGYIAIPAGMLAGALYHAAGRLAHA